jgi:hypothetical protein
MTDKRVEGRGERGAKRPRDEKEGRERGERESARPAVSSSDATACGSVVKEHAGLRELSNPAETGTGYARRPNIFLLFPLPVKVTRRGDNQD